MAVAAGVSALASAGGATACAIISAKNSAEEEKHYRELESIARGNGKSNLIDNIKNYNNLKPSKELLDDQRSDRFITINSHPIVNNNCITIDPKLAAVIEVIYSAVKTIKTLINNEGNKIDEVIKI